jgi:hypothetical protein
MKYETPQMTTLTSAITAIQETSSKGPIGLIETFHPEGPWPEVVGAYTDWE